MYDRTVLAGAYPNALDAALSPGSKARSNLVEILSMTMNLKSSDEFQDLQRSPPFPMPYTRPTLKTTTVANGPSTCSDLQWICNLPVSLAPQDADISCAIRNEEIIVQVLIQLVIGTGPEFKLYEDWIRNDVRYGIL